jgi:hypothetical protein
LIAENIPEEINLTVTAKQERSAARTPIEKVFDILLGHLEVVAVSHGRLQQDADGIRKLGCIITTTPKNWERQGKQISESLTRKKLSKLAVYEHRRESLSPFKS